jgi:hypothetical protein
MGLKFQAELSEVIIFPFPPPQKKSKRRLNKISSSASITVKSEGATPRFNPLFSLARDKLFELIHRNRCLLRSPAVKLEVIYWKELEK